MDTLGTEPREATDKLPRLVCNGGVGAERVAFDETLPFPPPMHPSARRAELSFCVDDAAGEPLSLEQLTELQLDAAQEQAAAEYNTSALALLPPAHAALPVTALRWRGQQLSAEFQAYAVRVSRGEQLEPYRGQVLAESSAEFPWQSFDESPPLRSKAPRVVMLLLLALCLVAAVSGGMATGEDPGFAGSGEAVRASEAAAYASQSPAAAPEPVAPGLPEAPSAVRPASYAVAPAATPLAVQPAVQPAVQLSLPKRVEVSAARPKQVPHPAPASSAEPAADDTSLLVERPSF